MTEGRIRELALTERQRSEIRLLLVNCLYFKGEWERPFERGATSDRPFHSGAETLSVGTMWRKGEFKVSVGPGFRLLELPYRGDRLVFDCLLPDKLDGLQELHDKLDWKMLHRALAGLQSESVILSLPRFRVESELEAGAALQTLGVRRAFAETAQFEGIAPYLWISSIHQQTWLELDEKGTEVAVVTHAVMASASPEKPHEFTVDHPFMFLIRDRGTGLILFMGQVVRP